MSASHIPGLEAASPQSAPFQTTSLIEIERTAALRVSHRPFKVPLPLSISGLLLDNDGRDVSTPERGFISNIT